VGILGARFRFVEHRAGGEVRLRPGRREVGAGCLYRVLGEPGGIRSHVGDEAYRTLGPQFDPFVETLGGAHGLPGRKVQPPCGFLLESAGDEGRRGVPAPFLELNLGHLIGQGAEKLEQVIGFLFG